jgi:hypothetical protein
MGLGTSPRRPNPPRPPRPVPALQRIRQSKPGSANSKPRAADPLAARFSTVRPGPRMGRSDAEEASQDPSFPLPRIEIDAQLMPHQAAPRAPVNRETAP